uniref:Uncharacterized protein n=1 Tax=Kwoniella bestiolae CBS 10118 TaxID=1296100 RepID=A0A1B9G685_9TREE|nr:hypothetical protein I302_04204 [Kwoniella bestiolae CBS 10118]OCF26518.1 hypothetical protein I302_04204 [Kwoniella bestiolae CBS 10118]
MSKRRYTDTLRGGEDLRTAADANGNSPTNQHQEEEEDIDDTQSPPKRSRVDVAFTDIAGEWADGRDLYTGAEETHTHRLSADETDETDETFAQSSSSKSDTFSARKLNINDTNHGYAHFTPAPFAPNRPDSTSYQTYPYTQPISQGASASSRPAEISRYHTDQSRAQPASSSIARFHDHEAEVEHLRQRLRDAEDRVSKAEQYQIDMMEKTNARVRVLIEHYEGQGKNQHAQIVDLKAKIAVLEKRVVDLKKRVKGSPVDNHIQLQNSVGPSRKHQHPPRMFETLNKSVRPSHFAAADRNLPSQQDLRSSHSVTPSATLRTLSSETFLDEDKMDHYVRGNVSHIDYSEDTDVELEIYFQGLSTYDKQLHSQGFFSDFDEGKEAEWACENIEGDLDALVGSFQEVESERLEEDAWMDYQESICEENCEEDHLFEWECEGDFGEEDEHLREALLAEQEEEELNYYVEMYYHDLELLKNPLEWNGDWSFDVEDYGNETEPEEGDWVLFSGAWIRYRTDKEDEEQMEVDDDRVPDSQEDAFDSLDIWEDVEYW